MQLRTLLLLLLASGAAAAPAPSDRNSTCSPGSRLDLSKFSLQLPAGSNGNPTTVSGSELCSGYQSDVFSKNADGAIVLKVQGDPSNSGCVTTSHSMHCRNELREQEPRKWSPSSSQNRMRVELQVTKNSGTICVGQIHIDDSISTKPVAELYINGSGKMSIGVQNCKTCSQSLVDLTSVDPSQRFSYELRYEKSQLSVAINGGEMKMLSTSGLDSPDSYYKLGNYNQGSDATEVHVYSVEVTHA